MLEKCPACDQSDCLTYYNTEIKSIICKKCEVIFLEEKQVRDINCYKNNSHAPQKIKVFIQKRFSSLASEHYIEYLQSKTNMFFKNALDIGAGYGVFVDKLNKMGIDAYGIEFDQNAIKFSVTKKIEDVHFNEKYSPKTKYDLISLTHGLYYFHDNYEILEKIKNMLTDDGLIFIVTHNTQYPVVKRALKQYFGGPQFFLSKLNFESLKTKLGLEMIDCTVYQSNFAMDFNNRTKNKQISFWINMIRYFLKLKKFYFQANEGVYLFILLKSVKKI